MRDFLLFLPSDVRPKPHHIQ